MDAHSTNCFYINWPPCFFLCRLRWVYIQFSCCSVHFIQIAFSSVNDTFHISDRAFHAMTLKVPYNCAGVMSFRFHVLPFNTVFFMVLPHALAAPSHLLHCFMHVMLFYAFDVHEDFCLLKLIFRGIGSERWHWIDRFCAPPSMRRAILPGIDCRLGCLSIYL